MREDLKDIYRHIDDNFDKYIELTREYFRNPAISILGEGLEKEAEETVKHIRAIGGEAEIVPLTGPTAGYPVAHGKLKSNKKNAKTLLYYSHYDDVDVIPEDWTVPPFAAEIVDAETINMPAELGKVIVARSAVDKKGAVMALILALGAIREVRGDVPLNVIFAVEGEEEILSPNFKQYVDKYHDVLNEADAVWAEGSYQQLASGLVILQRGYNGCMDIDLEIKGGSWGGTSDGKPLWSAYADFVDQPLVRLVHAIGTMLSPEGDILIEDFYENWIPPTEEEKAELGNTIDRLGETGILTALNSVKRFRKGGKPEDYVLDLMTKPHLIPLGIKSGYEELIPMKANARFHCRFVPNMSSEEILQKIKRHLHKNGFPEVKVTTNAANEWSRSPVTENVTQALIKMAELHGVDYVVWPSTPATMPFYLFNRPPLNKPVAMGSLGHGDRFHIHDEYITVEGFRDKMKGIVTFLHEFAEN